MERSYSYFSHRDCEYYPCHQGADPDNFNCLFCYCPFYLLGPDCGGNFVLGPGGYKDCSGCLYPHLRENYDGVVGRLARMGALREQLAGTVLTEAGIFPVPLEFSG